MVYFFKIRFSFHYVFRLVLGTNSIGELGKISKGKGGDECVGNIHSFGRCNRTGGNARYRGGGLDNPQSLQRHAPGGQAVGEGRKIE